MTALLEAAAARTSTEKFVDRLLELGRSCGQIPVYGSDSWEQLDPVDPRRFAAVVQAAEAWRHEGTDDAIAQRLRADLADNNWLAAWRLRRMSGDLSEALDWTEEASRLGQHPITAQGWIYVYEVTALRQQQLRERTHGGDTAWPPASLVCPLDCQRPAARGFAGVPRFGACGPSCCRRRGARRHTRPVAA